MHIQNSHRNCWENGFRIEIENNDWYELKAVHSISSTMLDSFSNIDCNVLTGCQDSCMCEVKISQAYVTFLNHIPIFDKVEDMIMSRHK